MFINRREVLKTVTTAACAVGLNAAVPSLFLESALASEQADSSDNVLIVVQLSGGNDGLNTVIPFRDGAYYRARPKLAVSEDQALKISDDLGLHPSMSGLGELFKEGSIAIVQGVGYAQPNRSHFESMDIWHTCQLKAQRSQDGWLGRYLDRERAKWRTDSPAIHLGSQKQPYALASQMVRTPSIASVERFRLTTGPESSSDKIRSLAVLERQAADGLLDFVRASTESAIKTSERIEVAKREYRSAVEYPASGLAEKLRTVAQFLDAGLKTRVFYLELDGFDTHAEQPQTHSILLAEFSKAYKAFYDDIVQHGHGGRVLTFAFSEFGRRVQENASLGTDHGAAAPVFLLGSKVKGGFHGPMPSLTDLDDGDQKFHTDFRRVFATLLEKWLGCSSEAILGGRYEPLSVLA